MIITPETKVGDLLDAQPGAEAALIAIAPRFKALKNPVLRRTVAKVATLEQAARVADMPVNELVLALREALGQDVGEMDRESEPGAGGGDAPTWIAVGATREFDADAMLGLTEAELLAPLDAAARAEVETAARQVATVTAIVPLALADVATALTANIRMIRRIAEIYGGRAGTLGSLRLARSVMTHLVATGAVAVGDDLIGSVAGGGMLSKVSRRFGEGVINGALTARVGIAAIEVCRPLPFRRLKRPGVTSLVQRALTGLFGQGRG